MLSGKDASAGTQNIAECRVTGEVENGIPKRIISLYYSIIHMLQARSEVNRRAMICFVVFQHSAEILFSQNHGGTYEH
jgi:hypothetical protein